MTSLGRAVNTIAIHGDDALLGVSEANDKGIDLNGDSVADDTVLRYVNLAGGANASRNLAIVSGSFTFFRHPGGTVRIAAFLSEGQSPTYGDLNVDGDTADVALLLVSVDPAPTTPVIVAGTPFLAGIAAVANAPPLRAGNEAIVFPTFEPMDNHDLSGDSDIADTVLRYATYRPPS
jgi:hypothetical protein